MNNEIPHNGSTILILNAGDGAVGVNGKVGTVTNKKSDHGLLDDKPGYNVQLVNGDVWRINLNATINIINN